MKSFKKRGLWELFIFVVLAGAFFIVNLSLQKQSPGVSNVIAQDWSGSEQRSFPSDIMFSNNSTSRVPMDRIFPSDVMFGPTNLSHPGDIMFPAAFFPGDIILGGSNGKTEMRTILTCSGCTQTMATCDWDCGPTFSYCKRTDNRYGSNNTIMTCSSSLFGGCGGINTTSMTCSSGFFCGGSISTSTTCSGGIFCGGSISTSTTCSGGIFCGGITPTFTTCSGGILCGGGNNTISTCVGRCPAENPPIFPVGYGPSWSPEGMPLPGSILTFPNFSSMPYSPVSMAGW